MFDVPTLYSKGASTSAYPETQVAFTAEQIRTAEADGTIPPAVSERLRTAQGAYNRLKLEMAPIKDALEKSERRRNSLGAPVTARQAERETALVEQLRPMQQQATLLNNEIRAARQERDALLTATLRPPQQSRAALDTAAPIVAEPVPVAPAAPAAPSEVTALPDTKRVQRTVSQIPPDTVITLPVLVEETGQTQDVEFNARAELKAALRDVKRFTALLECVRA
jgi:hypothetical protein